MKEALLKLLGYKRVHRFGGPLYFSFWIKGL